MNIQVKAGYPLDKIVGPDFIPVSIADGASVADLIEHLTATYPELGSHLSGHKANVQAPFNYFVNRKVVRDQALGTTILKDGDRLHILRPVVGG